MLRDFGQPQKPVKGQKVRDRANNEWIVQEVGMKYAICLNTQGTAKSMIRLQDIFIVPNEG